jgi:predicted phage tail protein
MTTNAEAIAALVASKEEFRKKLETATGETKDQLETSFNNTSDEIDAKVLEALMNSPYIPATDAFKKETEEGQEFLNKLKTLKAIFGAIDPVSKAADTVIKLIIGEVK